VWLKERLCGRDISVLSATVQALFAKKTQIRFLLQKQYIKVGGEYRCQAKKCCFAMACGNCSQCIPEVKLGKTLPLAASECV
jgi:hypothetical protein